MSAAGETKLVYASSSETITLEEADDLQAKLFHTWMKDSKLQTTEVVDLTYLGDVYRPYLSWVVYAPYDEGVSSTAPRVAKMGRVIEVVGDGSFASLYVQLFCYDHVILSKEGGGLFEIDSTAFDASEAHETFVPMETLLLTPIKHNFDEQKQRHCFYFYD